MDFKVKPFGNKYRFDQQSDIVDVIYTVSGLRLSVIAATSKFTNVYLDIHFSSVGAFRLLDEADLTAYWEDDAFSSDHHIYEILSGGWSNGEPVAEGIMSNREFVGYREWFIATTNRCMNILSHVEPMVREITNSSVSS